METKTPAYTTEGSEIRNCLGLWKSFLDEKLINNLAIFAKRGQLQVDVSNFDDSERWDGELLIKLTGINTQDLVNFVIGMAFADEISIQDDVLRLWWD